MSSFKDRIKKELERVNNSGNFEGGDDLFWKPIPGKQIIRLLPNPFEEDGFPFLKLQLYNKFGVFGKSMISPNSYGDDDPILDFARKLFNKDSQADKDAARKLFPSTRTFVLVLVKDAQGNVLQGPSWWNFGKTIYNDFLGIMGDDDYGNISDLKEGRDVTVEYTLGSGATEREQKMHATTQIRPKPNASIAYTDESLTEKIKNIKNIEDVFPKPTFEELEEMLRSYLKVSSEEESVNAPASEQPNTEDSKPTAPKKDTKVSDGVDKLEKMFDELPE